MEEEEEKEEVVVEFVSILLRPRRRFNTGENSFYISQESASDPERRGNIGGIDVVGEKERPPIGKSQVGVGEEINRYDCVVPLSVWPSTSSRPLNLNIGWLPWSRLLKLQTVERNNTNKGAAGTAASA